MVILDEQIVATLDRHLDDDVDRSVPIDLTRWRQRTRAQRVLELATTPIRRWL